MVVGRMVNVNSTIMKQGPLALLETVDSTWDLRLRLRESIWNRVISVRGFEQAAKAEGGNALVSKTFCDWWLILIQMGVAPWLSLDLPVLITFKTEIGKSTYGLWSHESMMPFRFQFKKYSNPLSSWSTVKSSVRVRERIRAVSSDFSSVGSQRLLTCYDTETGKVCSRT